jgi:DNA-binding transcriptional regulator YdaS (Cro superfamily)
MSTETPQARTLRRALKVRGSIVALAKALGVSAADLSAWMNGHVALPTAIYIKALDLVASSPGSGGD